VGRNRTFTVGNLLEMTESTDNYYGLCHTIFKASIGEVSLIKISEDNVKLDAIVVIKHIHMQFKGPFLLKPYQEFCWTLDDSLFEKLRYVQRVCYKRNGFVV